MDERRPLLATRSSSSAPSIPAPSLTLRDPHIQFCLQAGIPPSNLPKGAKWPQPPKTSIYQRVKRSQTSQNRTYIFTAVLTQSLLLVQVILSAVLTALGAANSPGIYVAVFGAVNTVIGGLLAYFKGRGQPSRARLYREELESCIRQIENSEIMWSGITRNMHGYDEIDIDDEVSVRSEVARLTRLYEKAVKANTLNNPDFAQPGSGHDETGGLRARPVLDAPVPDTAPAPAPAAAAPPPADPASAAATTPAKKDPDEAPDVKPDDKPADASKPSPTENGSADKANSPTSPAPTPAATPVVSATAAPAQPAAKDEDSPATKA